MSDLAGAVWFITGCSTGLGRVLAERVLARGGRVVATARKVESLAELVAVDPARVRAVALDVTDAPSIPGVVQQAAQAFGGLDVVCSNAGYGLIAALEECTQEQIERNLATNLLGPIHLMRAVLPVLRSQPTERRGHILVVSAIAALSNHEGFSIYGGAKAGLEGVCEALAIETRPLGIKVSMVLPGPTRTDFIARSLDRPASPMPEYAQTSGKFANLLSSMSGKQTGDPVKVADLMIETTLVPNPPLRLVTGKYAINRARAKLRQLAGDLDAWEARGLATDF